MIEKIQDYLKAHPWLSGLVQAAEGALAGALTSILTDWTTGGYTMSRAGLEKMGVFVAASIGIAIRNYLKQSPRQAWTPEQRAQNLGGNDATKTNGAAAGGGASGNGGMSTPGSPTP